MRPLNVRWGRAKIADFNLKQTGTPVRTPAPQIPESTYCAWVFCLSWRELA